VLVFLVSAKLLFEQMPMPKIVHPICCGIDVHKSFVVACIATTNEKFITTYSKPKRFSTFTNDLRRLAK
jgi:predicted transposase